MKLYEAFHHIAGCSLGTWSNRDTALACIDFIQEVENHPGYNETFPDLARYYRELASESSDGDIDVEYYASLIEGECNHVLPASCCFSWGDGEFRITPYIDDCLLSFDELPEKLTPIEDVIYVVNDHGNTDCYEWQHGENEYKLIWSMV